MFGKIVSSIDAYAQASQVRPGEWVPMWCVHFTDGTERRCIAPARVDCTSEADAKTVAQRHADHWFFTRERVGMSAHGPGAARPIAHRL